MKNEDVAKSTWARLQSAHGDVLANLRMQAVRVDLGDKGVWYRVQAGPLDEKQAQNVCGTLKTPQGRLRARSRRHGEFCRPERSEGPHASRTSTSVAIAMSPSLRSRMT